MDNLKILNYLLKLIFFSDIILINERKDCLKMEEIFNDLIAIDEECKKTLNELKEKQENIEYLVNDELSTRKDEIKAKYKFKMDMRKNEQDMRLSETIKKIEMEKAKQIEQIKSAYENDKENAIKQIVDSII